jgi:hypothetical protein
MYQDTSVLVQSLITKLKLANWLYHATEAYSSSRHTRVTAVRSSLQWTHSSGAVRTSATFSVYKYPRLQVTRIQCTSCDTITIWTWIFHTVTLLVCLHSNDWLITKHTASNNNCQTNMMHNKIGLKSLGVQKCIVICVAALALVCFCSFGSESVERSVLRRGLLKRGGVSRQKPAFKKSTSNKKLFLRVDLISKKQ